MSQAKVDRYKDQKANRKEIMKKQKRHNQMLQVVGAFIGIVMLGWIGYSVYNSYEASQPREVVEVDYTEFETYLYSIGVEEE